MHTILSARCSEHWLRQEPLSHHFYRFPLVWFAAAAVLGAWLSETAWMNNALLLGSLALAASLAVLTIRLQQPGYQVMAFGLGLATACLAGACYARATAPRPADGLSELASPRAQPVAVRGVIASGAVWKPNENYRPEQSGSEAWGTHWEVEWQQIRDAKQWRPIDARSRLAVDGRITDLLPGDRVEVFAALRRIPPASNPGGFDYANFFRRQSQFVSLRADSREQILSRGRAPEYMWQRIRARSVRWVDGLIHKHVAQEQAPLAAALVFGQREQVDWEQQQALMATGTLHLLAISGMHVEIVAGLVLLAGSLLAVGTRWTLVAVVSICCLYAALAGGKPPVLRAVLLISAFAVARALGRKARLANALGMAAIVLFMLHTSNVHNVGVHLSFVAVGAIGIFVIGPEHRLRRDALQIVVAESLSGTERLQFVMWRWCNNMLRLSFWVWLLTAPLVWYNFHVLAPVAIPLNVLIALPLTLSLAGGLVTALLGWLPLLGTVSGGICSLSLWLIGWLIAWGHRIPGGHFWLASPPSWMIYGFYAWAGMWLLIVGRRSYHLLAISLICWLVAGLQPSLWGVRGLTGTGESVVVGRSSDEQLRCTFLNVGHGTSVVIEFPDGQVWLYDAGRLGASSRAHVDVANALWSLPTSRLERLIVSHADADHYNAVPGLLDRFSIGSLTSTEQFWQSEDREVHELLELLKEREIVRQNWSGGSRGTSAGVAWKVLHPRRGWRGETDNADSLCLLLEYGGRRVLLPGDLEGKGLNDLVELPPRPCDVLMAPHHGSISLDPQELLHWCQPEVVVISGNHRAARQAVRDRYEAYTNHLGITFQDGAIQVRITVEGMLSMWQWNGEQWRTWGTEPL